MKKIKKWIILIVVLAVVAIAAFLFVSMSGEHGKTRGVVNLRADMLQADIAGVAAKVDARSDALEGELARIDAKLDRIEGKLDRLIEMATPKLPDGMEPAR